MAVLEIRPAGLYCPAGDFYIDPWQRVERAIITHAHSDHARWGMRHYLTSTPGGPILRARLGPDIALQTLDYGSALTLGGARVSLHPAGHIPGSAQVRVEVDGEIWVVSGDYKTEPDRTATPFEPIRCHGFVTETTFGLPIYRWEPEAEIARQILTWWQSNRAAGRTSVLFAYSLGKAQRLLAALGDHGPVVVHGSVATMNHACAEAGVHLPPWHLVSTLPSGIPWADVLVIAPPSAHGSPWMRRFADPVTAFASGWMSVRGARRRRGTDTGFVLSDHVDWPSLLQAVAATRAETVWTTHGYADTVARYFREQGLHAAPIATEFVGDRPDAQDDAPAAEDA